MQWRKIDKKIPDSEGDYLVLLEDLQTGQRHVQMGRFMWVERAFGSDRNGGCWNMGKDTLQIAKVIAWHKMSDIPTEFAS